MALPGRCNLVCTISPARVYPLLPPCLVDPWKGLEEVEFATLEWVDWFNNVRLLEPIGYVPPAEFEEAYYAHAAATEAEERLEQESLH